MSFTDWGDFKELLSAFSKAFGRFYRLDRFRDICIDANPTIRPEQKRVFRDMFRHICPSFAEHRWEHLFETLAWVIPRKEAFQLLKLDDLLSPSSSAEQDGEALSAYQLELLAELSQTTKKRSAQFWATAALADALAKWGHWFTGTLHGCPCHNASEWKELSKHKTCPMTGRTAVLLASGLPQLAIQQLEHLRQRMPAAVRQPLAALEAIDRDAADKLVRDFHTAVARLRFRTLQNFSYWQELPWALIMLMRPFLDRFDDDSQASECLQLSRSAAILLISCLGSCELQAVECGGPLSPTPS